METLSSSGKNCSSRNNPWQILENTDTSFKELSSRQKDDIVRAYAQKIKITASRLKHRLPKHVEVAELVSAGTLGLMEALGNFDPKHKIKFETFADNRIKGAMLDELRKMDWFSRGLRKKVKRLEECIHDFEQNSGIQPTNLEIKKITGYSLDEVEEGLLAWKLFRKTLLLPENRIFLMNPS
ncbi:MAG: sigma-70 family RNA polymerase sigma factor [Desulfonatronovibrio sp.]